MNKSLPMHLTRNIRTGRATEMEVPSRATIKVRTDKVKNTRMPRLPRENSPMVGLSFEDGAGEGPLGLGRELFEMP